MRFLTMPGGLAAVLTLTMALAVILSLLGRLHGAFDTIAHFRLHLVALLCLCAAAALLLGQWPSAVAGAAVAAAAIAFTAPHLPGAGFGSANASGPVLRVVTFNRLHDNDRTELAAEVITSASPDIVIMQEVKGTPNALMQRLADDYPHQLRCADDRVGGTAVLSRLPLARDDATLCFDTSFLSAVTVRAGEREVTFASYHGDWPWPWGQHDRIRDLAPALESLPHPLVIGGDFNAAPWSEGVLEVARASGTRVAPGLRPTWLTPRLPQALRQPLGLPLDHLLVSEGVRIAGARRLPHAGSDHLPLLFEITLE